MPDTPTLPPSDAPAPGHRSIETTADVDEVWGLIIDDDARADWFGGTSTLDPVPGGHGSFVDPDGTRRRATVTEVEPARHIAWTWAPEEDDDGTASSTVSIELTPTPGGTRIGVTERPATPAARALLTETGPTATGPTATCMSRDPLFELEHRLLLRSALAVAR